MRESHNIVNFHCVFQAVPEMTELVEKAKS